MPEETLASNNPDQDCCQDYKAKWVESCRKHRITIENPINRPSGSTSGARHSGEKKKGTYDRARVEVIEFLANSVKESKRNN